MHRFWCRIRGDPRLYEAKAYRIFVPETQPFRTISAPVLKIMRDAQEIIGKRRVMELSQATKARPPWLRSGEKADSSLRSGRHGRGKW